MSEPSPLPPPTALTHVDAGGDAFLGRVVSNRYRIEARIGQGSMGIVYRAVQIALGKTVAFKLLSHGLGGDALDRFLQEARVAATLKHPGIAEVYDFGTLGEGLPYYVMEYLEGTDLERRMAACGPLAPRLAVGIATAVASAMAAAHASGIVHRDIKPANIFLVPRPTGGDSVKVVDFGLSKILAGSEGSLINSQLTLPGVVCGTPYYMSPEQVAGRPVDGRTDIYSLGAVLYEMLCGHPPFDAPEAIHVLGMHLSTPPPPLRRRSPGPRVAEAIEAVVMRALAKEPDDRFASMSEFKRAMEAAAGLQPASSGINPAYDPEIDRMTAARRRRVWFAAGAAVLAAGALGAAVWWVDHPTAEPPIPVHVPRTAAVGPEPAARDEDEKTGRIEVPEPAQPEPVVPQLVTTAPEPGRPPARPARSAPRPAAPDLVALPPPPLPPPPAAAEPATPSYRLDDLKPYE